MATSTSSKTVAIRDVCARRRRRGARAGVVGHEARGALCPAAGARQPRRPDRHDRRGAAGLRAPDDRGGARGHDARGAPGAGARSQGRPRRRGRSRPARSYRATRRKRAGRARPRRLTCTVRGTRAISCAFAARVLRLAGARARLSRGGRTLASGIVRGRVVRMRARRAVRPGAHILTITRGRGARSDGPAHGGAALSAARPRGA